MTSDAIRSSRAELEAELKRGGCKVRHNSVTCPAHEDKHASASLYESGGVWRVKCHVPTCGFCGDVFDVRAKATGRARPELIREAAGESADSEPQRVKPKRVFATVDEVLHSIRSLGEVEDHYVYCDPSTGDPQILQVRYRDQGVKRFLVHHAVAGGFVLGAPPKPWPIYNRARLGDAEAVVVVEGEKCVHALHRVGITATTSLSGASNADKADWSPLAGKRVYVWPDNDEPGLKYAREVVRQLDALRPEPETFLMDPSSLAVAEGGDAADLVTDDATGEEMWTVIRECAERVGAAGDLAERIDEIIEGQWRSLTLPWKHLSRCSKPLFPGSITVLCGDPAASKSFFAMQLLVNLRTSGVQAEVLELEDDRKFHLLRALAQLSGRWDVLDDTWGHDHPDELRALYEEQKKHVADLSPAIHSAPLGQIRYQEVLKWIESRCAAGVQVLMIDPITAVYTGDSRHLDDLNFIVNASSILRTHGARLILVTHPRVGAGKRITSGQDDLAGGRAFSRHTQTVLWLNRHDPPKKFYCGINPMPVECNRSVTIAKSRNAVGHGWRIAFRLTKEVEFVEEGIVRGEAE